MPDTLDPIEPDDELGEEPGEEPGDGPGDGEEDSGEEPKIDPDEEEEITETPYVLSLCFVRGNWAYFTSGDYMTQDGRNWDKSPIKLAEPPQSKPDAEILKVAFTGAWRLPEDHTIAATPAFTVHRINRTKNMPWLRSHEDADKYLELFAGTTLLDFYEALVSVGAEAYVPLSQSLDIFEYISSAAIGDDDYVDDDADDEPITEGVG